MLRPSADGLQAGGLLATCEQLFKVMEVVMIARLHLSFFRGIGVIAVSAMMAASALAATYTWTPTGAGTYNWDNSGGQNNWGTGAGGAYPGTTGDVANMVLNITGPQTNNLNVAVTNSALYVRDTDNNQKFIIAAGAAGSLTFVGTNGNNAVLMFGGSGTEGGNCPLITAPVMLNDALSVLNYNGGSRLEITGKLSSSGTKNIMLSGGSAGKIILKLDNAANDFTGDIYATNIVGSIGYISDNTAVISCTSDGSLGNANNDIYLNVGQIYANGYGNITLGAGRKIDVGANGGLIVTAQVGIA